MRADELVKLNKLFMEFRECFGNTERKDMVAMEIELHTNIEMEVCRNKKTVKDWKNFLKSCEKKQLKIMGEKQ